MKLKVYVGEVQTCYFHNQLFQNFLKLLDNEKFEPTENIQEADIILFLHCVIVGYYIRNAQNILNKIKLSRKSGSILMVAACLTKTTKINLDGVDYILGEDWVNEALNILNDKYYENATNMWQEYDLPSKGGYVICRGCNSKCSFCKVHYMDIPLKSTPIEVVFENIRKMADNGVIYLELFGLSIGQYGIDLYGYPRLHEILAYVESINKIKMLHLIEISPKDMYPELLFQIAKSKKIKKLNLPIQTASNRILKLMNRGYKIEDVTNIINTIRSINPDIYFDTTVMVSFPTETMDDVWQTINYLKENNLGADILCKYQNYECIPSSKLEQLSENEYLSNFNTMYIEMGRIEKNYCKTLIGKVVDVFVEEMQNNFAIGDYKHPIIIQKVPANVKGKIIRCKLLHYKNFPMRAATQGTFFADYIETIE